ncbi:Hypothetical predicted protein [Pelobates cultripes]|uniref:Uncharacterized protein n=1 Tax=Pelobates cultripes TaxID=61616 RepID=A0AAD1T0E7_PELCU|nr:Hypothetical predicted protein [Pelobates cultripes]
MYMGSSTNSSVRNQSWLLKSRTTRQQCTESDPGTSQPPTLNLSQADRGRHMQSTRPPAAATRSKKPQRGTTPRHPSGKYRTDETPRWRLTPGPGCGAAPPPLAGGGYTGHLAVTRDTTGAPAWSVRLPPTLAKAVEEPASQQKNTQTRRGKESSGRVTYRSQTAHCQKKQPTKGLDEIIGN